MRPSPIRRPSGGAAVWGAGAYLVPAVSRSQQQAAGAALAAKRGQRSVASLKGAALQMYRSMTAAQLEEFASTKSKGLPKRVRAKKKGRRDR